MKNIIIISSIFLSLLIFISSCKKEETNTNIYNSSLICPTVEMLQEFYDEGYTHVAGNIEINDCGGVVDLHLFSNLKSVGMIFWIRGNHGLKSLDGLDSLKYIGGYLSITNNDSLANLNGLQSLEQVEGISEFTPSSIVITGNDNLTNLCGIRRVLELNGATDTVVISRNLFNPTISDIIAGNCSQ